jgi:hypothetical protein
LAQRYSLNVIRSALALSVIATAGVATMSACGNGDDTTSSVSSGADAAVSPGDAGSRDATTVGLDATEEEASCAVDAGPLDDAQVALGLALVGVHMCAQCHGSVFSGNNDGVMSLTAEGGTAYPPNLTSDPATGLGCWTNGQIENAILNGVDREGLRLCSPMPVFGQLGDAGLDPAQAAAIVQYLRSLAIASNEVPPTPNCPVPEAGADAGSDAGLDGGVDAGSDASPDGGVDAGNDAAYDAGDGGDAASEAGDATLDSSIDAAGTDAETNDGAGD